MSKEEVIVAPVEESKDTKPEAEQEKSEKTEPSKTIGDALDTKQESTVPESAFLQKKKDLKAAEKRIKELEALVQEGATKAEISDDVDSIAEEFGVDKTFLKKLTAAIEKKADEKIKPIAEKEKAARIDAIFNKSFDEAMETLPELKGIVSKGVIKTLSLDPSNQRKTFVDLIQEVYGSAVQGKHTIERTTPRGGKSPEEIDFNRIKKDTAYFKEIMSDPATKAKYNEGLAKRLNL